MEAGKEGSFREEGSRRVEEGVKKEGVREERSRISSGHVVEILGFFPFNGKYAKSFFIL